MTSTKFSDMTMKQFGGHLLELWTRQGVSFILISLVAYFSFTRMEALEVKWEKNIINHKDEIKNIYSEDLDDHQVVITTCMEVLQENIFLMRELREERKGK